MCIANVFDVCDVCDACDLCNLSGVLLSCLMCIMSNLGIFKSSGKLYSGIHRINLII